MMRISYNGKTPYSLQFNIKDMDLVANCPDPVRILELEIMASHSHHTDRANSTGGGTVTWLLKLLVLGKLLFMISSSTCLNVKLPTSAFIFNIIWFGHHNFYCHMGHLEKVNMGTYKCKEGKGGLL